MAGVGQSMDVSLLLRALRAVVDDTLVQIVLKQLML